MGTLQLYNEVLWAVQNSGGTVPPAGLGVVNGQPHDMQGYVGGANAPYWFRASVTTDQVGTLNIQQSEDGVTWFTDDSASSANTANKAHTIELKICQRFLRCQFVNGATPCTTFQMTSSLAG